MCIRDRRKVVRDGCVYVFHAQRLILVRSYVAKAGNGFPGHLGVYKAKALGKIFNEFPYVDNRHAYGTLELLIFEE